MKDLLGKYISFADNMKLPNKQLLLYYITYRIHFILIYRLREKILISTQLSEDFSIQKPLAAELFGEYCSSLRMPSISKPSSLLG